MSMFDFLKRNNENDDHNEPVRIGLEHQQQWTEIQDLSHQQPVYVFKHSSNCGISSMVLKRFEKQIKERNETYFYLHIQAYRTLSNWLSEELGIRHESPQLIVLKNGEVLAHDSHYSLLEILPKL